MSPCRAHSPFCKPLRAGLLLSWLALQSGLASATAPTGGLPLGHAETQALDTGRPQPVHVYEAELGEPPRPPADIELLLPRRSATAVQQSRASTGFSVDAASREQVRNFYNAIFMASEQIAAQWTGSVSTCEAGTVSSEYQQATLRRINYFRAMAGVPANVGLDPQFNRKAQQAALMLLANKQLSHSPPSSWNCYSTAGAEAAGSSNLSLGHSGPAAVHGQMRDDGSNNGPVGHRRWILYPQTQTMGTGDADVGGHGANALWVFDANYQHGRPAVRDGFVAWPPAGHVPYQLAFNRWSFSYPGADFSAATVHMTGPAGAMELYQEAVVNGYAENTVAWVPRIDPSQALAQDVAYQVSIQNVRIGGQGRSFSYPVTLIDPGTPGTDTVYPDISGNTHIPLHTTRRYSIQPVAQASGYEWTVNGIRDFELSDGAENGMAHFTDKTSGGYDVISPWIRRTGAHGFNLAHSRPQPQVLELNHRLIGRAGTHLVFSSRLALATPAQHAKVQVSIDGGTSWKTVFSRSGSVDMGERDFSDHSIDLSEFAGKRLNLRFLYEFSPTAESWSYYLPQRGNSTPVGWYLDDIRLTNASEVHEIESHRSSGPEFSFSRSVPGRYILFARAYIHGDYPLEWGNAFTVDVNAEGPPAPTPHPQAPDTVYRFYNRQSGSHFYTANLSERDHVIAHHPVFDYEGAAFSVHASAAKDAQPVYRFYNSSQGGHFYTISEAERDYVIAELPVFHYEGIAWYASPSAAADSVPLYRFYNTERGFHFYTRSQAERDFVIQSHPTFIYEGIAYHVWNLTSWSRAAAY